MLFNFLVNLLFKARDSVIGCVLLAILRDEVSFLYIHRISESGYELIGLHHARPLSTAPRLQEP